jgi:hypothetical protein
MSNYENLETVKRLPGSAPWSALLIGFKST